MYGPGPAMVSCAWLREMKVFIVETLSGKLWKPEVHEGGHTVMSECFEEGGFQFAQQRAFANTSKRKGGREEESV